MCGTGAQAGPTGCLGGSYPHLQYLMPESDLPPYASVKSYPLVEGEGVRGSDALPKTRGGDDEAADLFSFLPPMD